MRKRIALCMVALVLTLLGPGMALVVSRSFALTMERERARALGEEAAIARALTLETAEGNVGRSTASTLQTRYGSNELTIYLLQNGETITGEALPTVQKLPELLNTETRATLLDGASERLLIAHALDGEITLLTALDVSPVYALRRELLRGSGGAGPDRSGSGRGAGHLDFRRADKAAESTGRRGGKTGGRRLRRAPAGCKKR